MRARGPQTVELVQPQRTTAIVYQPTPWQSVSRFYGEGLGLDKGHSESDLQRLPFWMNFRENVDIR
jgi:hypothetical protein